MYHNLVIELMKKKCLNYLCLQCQQVNIRQTWLIFKNSTQNGSKYGVQFSLRPSPKLSIVKYNQT
jgi:hypothetical protein